MLNLVDNVTVKKPTIFSDHSQIICSINTLSPVSIHNETEALIETFNLPKQFLWENNSREKFVGTILSNEFQSRLLMFEQTYLDHTQDGINLATQIFTDLLNEISLRSLKLNCQKKARKKQHSKKWFDHKCFQLRKTLTELSNKKHRNPFDEFLRQDYHIRYAKNSKNLSNSRKPNYLTQK